jgi:hypothetical protein
MFAGILGVAGCDSGPWQRGPNLGIAVDETSGRALIALRRVRVRNLGPVPGAGELVITVLDSVGNELMSAPLSNAGAVQVPAARRGGAEGRQVAISGLPRFEVLTDSLLASKSRFGVRVTVHTVGRDADEADNTRSREWGSWLRVSPGVETTIQLPADVVPRKDSWRLAPAAAGQAGDIQVIMDRGVDGGGTTGSATASVIHLVPARAFRYGGVIAVRASRGGLATGDVVEGFERFAVYDTTPPLIGDYRMIHFRDGRIAIQLRAGDRDAELSEGAVSTVYSTDRGVTWHQRVHRSIEDDLGRPALFETIIGPFAADVAVLIGVSAEDVVGNVAVDVPADAAIFTAPHHAEWLLDSLDATGPDGHPLFAFQALARQGATVDRLAAGWPRRGVAGGQGSAGPLERFERRRLQDLRAIPDRARQMGVRLSGFTRADVMRLSVIDGAGVERKVIRLREMK